MHPNFILLLGLFIVLTCGLTRAQGKVNPAWSQRFKGWQKLFGAIVVVLALLIILNPEFLALGLLGDTAFFDMLVVALSLQMHLFVTRLWHECVSALTRGMRWVRIPSPGMLYLLAVSALAMGSTVLALRKAAHRIFS
jgi:uncharacterized membrane protein YkgB